ncbi:MAG: hypothetical protein AB9873_17640 [Syntrophobacteraceae bacterium]
MKPLLGFALFISVVLIPLQVLGDSSQWYFPKDGSWQPSDEVVREVEINIEAHVRKMAKQKGRELRLWPEYSFQLQGREKNGKKYIYVNALCNSRDTYLLERSLIIVMDGGNCFFNIKYDPVNKVFYDLFINGEA